MEVLQIDGVTYKKVSSAARDTGYTADYIGQLCRSGKINARLVGRTWYVDIDAVTGHKRSKPRSNAAKTRKSLNEEVLKVEAESNRTTQIPLRVQGAPEYRKRLLSAEVRYESDHAPLVPEKAAVEEAAIDEKPHTIAVQKSLDIASEEETPVEVEEPVREKQETKWNGTIVVSEIDPEAPLLPEEDMAPEEAHTIEDGPITAPVKEPEKMPVSSHILTLEEEQQIRAIVKAQERLPTPYLSKLPMVVGGLATATLVFAMLFVQSVWTYESGTPTRDPHYTTAYDIGSIPNVASLIMKK